MGTKRRSYILTPLPPEFHRVRPEWCLPKWEGHDAGVAAREAEIERLGTLI